MAVQHTQSSGGELHAGTCQTALCYLIWQAAKEGNEKGGSKKKKKKTQAGREKCLVTFNLFFSEAATTRVLYLNPEGNIKVWWLFITRFDSQFRKQACAHSKAVRY